MGLCFGIRRAGGGTTGLSAVVAAVRRQRHDQLIAQALMVTFAMIVFDELGHGSAQRRFTDENHPVQTGFLDGSNETLREGVEIR